MMNEETMGHIDAGDRVFWECGCITIKGDPLEHRACKDTNCPVVTSLHKTAKKRGTPVVHRKG